MKPAPFSYYRTLPVPETVALLPEPGHGAKIRAGRQRVVPTMNFRLGRPDALVDVTQVPGLDCLQAEPDGLQSGWLPPRRPGCRNSPLTEAADDHGQHGQ